MAGVVAEIARQFGFEDLAEGYTPDQQISLLRERLLLNRYLVVLDGIEALEDVGALIDLLYRLTLRVFFLFTTRRSLGQYQGIEVMPVDGLEPAQCLQVLKAQCARFQVVCDVQAQQVALLHEFCGGSPGFVMLVAEQIRKTSVRAVLQAIEDRQLPPDMLDRLAYWFEPQLTRLHPNRQVRRDSWTLIMALCCAIEDGDTREWLQFVADLPDERYYPAENALASNYLLVRHASNLTAYSEVRVPLLIRSYLRGQLERLREDGLWRSESRAQKHLWVARLAVRLRRVLRRTVAQLEELERDDLLDGRIMTRYYALIEASHYWPQLEELTVRMTLKLHPLPIYNGDWDTWQREIAYATHILDRLGWHDQQVDLLADLQMLYFHAGRWDDLVGVFERIVALGERSGRPVPVAQALYMLVDAYYYLDRHEQVQGYIEQVRGLPLITEAQGEEAAVTQAWLCLVEALTLRAQGEFAGAIQQTLDTEEHIYTSEPLNIKMLGHVRQHQGLMDWVSGDYDRAESRLLEAWDIFTGEDDIFSQSFVEGNLGLVYWSMGRFEDAESHLLGSISIARMHGAQWHLAAQTGNLALILLYQGRLEEAHKNVEEHYALASQLNATHEANRATINRGAVLFHLGRTQEALTSLKRGLNIRGLSPMGKACLNLYLARCYAARSQFRTARPYLDDVQQVVDRTGSIALQIVLNRVRAEITRDPQEAQGWLQEALVLAEDAGRTFDRAACLLALSELPGNRDAQQNTRIAGVGLLQQMGADRWLEKAPGRKPLRLPTLV